LYGCAPEGGMRPAAGSEIPTDRMTYRTTPTTGDRVSLLGYGCMRWPTVPGAGDSGNNIDQEAVDRLVDYAIEHGVNYFDTSPAYCKGYSEFATGTALKRHPRESYFVATKLSNFAPSTWSREASMAMYRNSMRELQVDYIDYYLLHAIGMGNGMDDFESRYIRNGMLDFLVEERRAGRIRNLGFSYHGDIRVFDYLLSRHDEFHWDFVQIQLNWLDWRHAKEINPRNTDAEYLYGELQQRGIPAVIMEPLLGGRLSKVHDHIVGRLKQREPDRSVASWAFRFAGSLPGVLTVLSGMTYPEHLQDNLRSYCPLTPLTEEETQFLYDTADLMMQYPTIPCNDCKYCMPCPYGIDIPGVLLHYNRCVNEGNIPRDRQDPDYRRARRAFLVGYDRSVPRLRQSSYCIGCNECVSHCPQNIRIPQEMARIDRFVEHLKQETL
ncbi:MAG: aldo/keto reductase, partial [Alistipes sp.]|nr:aldo/keto reductase [Alistipes sp.]